MIELSDSLDRDFRDEVLTLRLNRPSRLNALNQALLDALDRAFTSLPSGVRIVVVRGNGRAFCSGYDLTEAAAVGRPAGPDEIRKRVERTQDVTRALRACRVPVLAAVHGYAVGGGVELAMSCDLIIASTTARFALPETELGLSVTNGLTHLLAQTIGPLRAKEFIMLGETISGHEAYKLGLVNRVVKEEDLDAEVAGVTRRILRKAPLSIELAKSLVNADSDADLVRALERETDAAVRAELGSHAQQMIREFADRGRRTFLDG